MVRINPDSLRSSSDLIVMVRGSKNHLIQMSHEQYQFVTDCVAPAFGIGVEELLLAVHGLGSKPLPNQECVSVGIDDLPIDVSLRDTDERGRLANIGLIDCDQGARKALERQARFVGLTTNRYICDLIARSLAVDEANSVLHPSSGAVLARRDQFGVLWKSVRLADPDVAGESVKAAEHPLSMDRAALPAS